MSPLSAAIKGILDTLAADAQITSLVPVSKFRYESAESSLKTPYITVNQLYGGDKNVSPRKEADLMVRVQVIETNQERARQVKDRIYDVLVGANLEFPSPWGYTAPITHLNDVADSDIIQQNKLFYYGHDIRVRMAE